jgi:hypothetical protein
MPQVRFETTIPAFEQTKTVHALDRAATVIGRRNLYILKISIYTYGRYVRTNLNFKQGKYGK